MPGWRVLIVLLAAAAAIGCTSPESTRSRAGGSGADVGNHGSPVQLHAGNNIYYGTRTDGAGIGQRAFIGGVAEAGE